METDESSRRLKYGLKFNEGCLELSGNVKFKVIVIQVGHGDSTLIEVTNDTGVYSLCNCS